MPMWPFRRRSGRKRPRSGAALSDADGPPLPSATEGVVPIQRAGSIKKQRTEPARLQRRVREQSYSPNRRDVLHVDRSARQATGIGQDMQELHRAWDRTPTLHATKDGGRRAKRRQSSRKQKKDPNREAEIKAMSQFAPVRPPADWDSAGRPMRKESRRTRRGAGGRHLEHDPASDVSLPLPASIHSTMSSDSEGPAFRISALDSLAPRPTLRYSTGARASAPVRTHSQRKTLAEKGAIAEETLRQHKRVDDLADDLDARDLRELMEREDRRRQKQRQREQRKMEERLSRRAQKQRAEAAEARKSGSPPPQNLERGVMGRDLVGLGIEPQSAVVTSSRVRDIDVPESMQDVQYDQSAEQSQLKQKPSDSFQPLGALAAENDKADSPPAPPAPEELPHAGSRRRSDAETEERVASLPSGSVLATLLRRNKSRSKSTLDSERDKTATPQSGRYDEDEQMRKNSETSYSKSTRFSISSLWRRGGKNRRRSASPPSFSNTSREEMQAVAYAHAQAAHQSRQPPAQSSQEQLNASHLAQAQALAKLEGKDVPQAGGGRYVAKNSGTAPKRTRSRFKEDLPEFPLSPPVSRVQSPEAEPPLPSLTEGRYAAETQPVPILSATRYGALTPDNRNADAMRTTPISPDPHQSISLASIDSEGSWLSGRMKARRTSAMHESLAHSAVREPVHSGESPTNSTREDLAIMDDEYMSQLASGRRHSAVPSSHMLAEGRPSSDEEQFMDEGDLKWGSTAGGHVRMVNRDTMRSRQGLFETIDGDEEQDESSSNESAQAAQENASLGRARSVDLAKRGHARNFSAGSAKLLDIAPRASADHTRSRRASAPLL